MSAITSLVQERRGRRRHGTEGLGRATIHPAMCTGIHEVNSSIPSVQPRRVAILRLSNGMTAALSPGNNDETPRPVTPCSSGAAEAWATSPPVVDDGAETKPQINPPAIGCRRQPPRRLRTPGSSMRHSGNHGQLALGWRECRSIVR